MTQLRLLARLIGWDVLREVRRRDAVPNMLLFALIVLFVALIGLGSEVKTTRDVAPVIFWIAIVFAGTVGLSQGFAAEREGGALAGIVTSPADPGTFYLAKVISTGLYVLIMEVVVVWLYGVLFGYAPGARLWSLVGALGVFTGGHMAAGVLLAAMTTTLRGGGEVVLRILIVPLMIPLIWISLQVSGVLFDAEIAGGALGKPMKLVHFFLAGLAFDTIYLSVGYLLFPKVLEE